VSRGQISADAHQTQKIKVRWLRTSLRLVQNIRPRSMRTSLRTRIYVVFNSL
jgi:hypothetical protein